MHLCRLPQKFPASENFYGVCAGLKRYLAAYASKLLLLVTLPKIYNERV